jgi:hypothetical protein
MRHKKEAMLSPHSYSFVYYYLLAGIILLVAAFLFVRPASADQKSLSYEIPPTLVGTLR